MSPGCRGNRFDWVTAHLHFKRVLDVTSERKAAMPIQWNDSYSTGIGEIDNQHKQLFVFINKLGEASQQSVSKDLLEKTLGFLETYVKAHFAFEEACMSQRKCPVAEKNRDAHQKFLEAFHGFKNRFIRDGANSALLQEIHSVSEKWITSHICKIDVMLKRPG